MKNKADYSKYKCPFEHLEKECGHELHGPEGFRDDNNSMEAYRIWCPCGFRGPAFYIDPVELKLEKKDNQQINSDQAPECNCFKPDTLVHESCPVHTLKR